MTFDMKNTPPLSWFDTSEPKETEWRLDVFELVEAIQVQPFGEIAFIQDSGFVFERFLPLLIPEHLEAFKRWVEEETSLRCAYGTHNLFMAVPNQEKAIERGKRDFLYVLLSLLSMNGKKVQIGIRGTNVS